MKRLPTVLRVGGHSIKVIEVDDIDGDDMGEYDADTNTISIRKSLATSKKEAILIHEIFHVLNNTFGYEEKNVNGLDHMFLDSLAEQFYQVLKDNKMSF